MGMFDPNCANLPPAQGGIYNVPTYNSEVGRKGGGALSASSSSSFPVISDAEQATMIEVAQASWGRIPAVAEHPATATLLPCYCHARVLVWFPCSLPVSVPGHRGCSGQVACGVCRECSVQLCRTTLLTGGMWKMLGHGNS